MAYLLFVPFKRILDDVNLAGLGCISPYEDGQAPPPLVLPDHLPHLLPVPKGSPQVCPQEEAGTVGPPQLGHTTTLGSEEF